MIDESTSKPQIFRQQLDVLGQEQRARLLELLRAELQKDEVD